MRRTHETCTVPGCSRPHKARGLCQAHHQRHMRGVPVAVEISSRQRVVAEHCSEVDCMEPVKAKGLCKMHYARLLRHGHTKYPDRKRPPKPCTAPGCENHLYAKGLCHQHYIRIKNMAKKYGTTPEQMDALLAAQGGVCAVCGGLSRSQNGSSGKVIDFHVDHCHETGTIRGMLCSHCNRGIGLFQDDPAILRRAADYLDRHRPPSA
jgi:hypothetical protein